MRYIAFATDYDGTLARAGHVDVFPKLALFDRVVVENGAILYNPSSREEKALADTPKEEFLAALRHDGVRFDVGRVVVSSWTPNERPILEVIRRLGLDYQVIFNKGAVMVLPSGVNKATGLRCALEDLHLSPHNTVAIGDGENDHSFLSASECGVAVANAVPALCQRADIVTKADHGVGVRELIEQIMANDLQSYDERLSRSALTISAPQKWQRQRTKNRA